MKKRVVVSGIGAVTPIGVGINKFWEACVNGISGVREITSFDASAYPTRIAAEVKLQDFDPKDYAEDDEMMERMGKSVQFATAAAQIAMADCGANTGKLDPARTGVVLGVTEDSDYLHGLTPIVLQAATRENGQKELDLKKYVEYSRSAPMARGRFFTSIPDFITTKIATRYHIQGPCCSVNTACATGSQAIGEAYRMIERRDADFIICGGTQALGGPITLLLFSLLNVISRNNAEPQKASRPFDAHRDGFVLGEGAGILILEGLEHALRRNAKIYGEVAGFGTSCDAYRVTDEPPDGRGAIASMRNALADAGISPIEVNYINAHGTSTPLNDRVETLAIKAVFGEYAHKIPVSSTKSMIGHLIAGAGAVELITCLLAIVHGIIPPTINYEYRDPHCDLDYVPNASRKASVDIALSNSFGFGGQNTSLIVRKFAE